MAHTRRSFLKTSVAVTAAVSGAIGIRLAVRRIRPTLLPPGAGSQQEFLARCVRCSQCIQACPIDVLQVSGAERLFTLGIPYVNAREQPCDLCQGRPQMECIAVCPTEALRPLRKRADVRMGTAVVDTDTCFPHVGVTCISCWHACPFPDSAISLDERGRPVVHEDQCVGCGICEHVCPTEVTSIRIVPMS